MSIKPFKFEGSPLLIPSDSDSDSELESESENEQQNTNDCNTQFLSNIETKINNIMTLLNNNNIILQSNLQTLYNSLYKCIDEKVKILNNDKPNNDNLSTIDNILSKHYQNIQTSLTTLSNNSTVDILDDVKIKLENIYNILNKPTNNIVNTEPVIVKNNDYDKIYELLISIKDEIHKNNAISPVLKNNVIIPEQKLQFDEIKMLNDKINDLKIDNKKLHDNLTTVNDKLSQLQKDNETLVENNTKILAELEKTYTKNMEWFKFIYEKFKEVNHTTNTDNSNPTPTATPNQAKKGRPKKVDLKK